MPVIPTIKPFNKPKKDCLLKLLWLLIFIVFLIKYNTELLIIKIAKKIIIICEFKIFNKYIPGMINKDEKIKKYKLSFITIL